MNRIPPLPRRERGMVLVIVLLLLIVVTLVGLAAMRGTVLQERMSGNTMSRSVAFQAAEAVLREAEAITADLDADALPESGCDNGLCAMPVDGEASAWEDDDFWESGDGYRTASFNFEDASGNDVDADLFFVIEDMGRGSTDGGATPGDDECPDGNAFDMSGGCGPAATGAEMQFYRIVAFAQLPDESRVILQSTYQVP